MNSEKKSVATGNMILIFIAMVLGVLIGVMTASHQRSKASELTLQSKMSEVLDLVESEYVDRIDADSLSERLIGVMMSELDPHSVYLSPRESQRAYEMMRGNFEGVGIVLHMEGDTVFVGNVIADGPSAGLGLLPGDMIWAVDGHQVSGVGMPTDSVVARLRGPRRSLVTVEIRRHTKPLTFKIRRGVVPYHSMNYSAMLDDTTGYILLTTFSTTSDSEVHDALRELKAKGMRHLILDLRGNTGGSLGSATNIANEFLPTGSLIVYTKGAHQLREDIHARPGGLFTKGRITVMVDEGSASASEVVSGALQDNDRALIVGRRSFGKGLVQREFDLSDGSSVMLTIARYYTPSGRSIQRPYDAGTDEYYRDYLNQLMEESYADNPSLHITDSTPYHTKGGRVVYGGGGIFPDRLIPYHKDSTLVYYNKLVSKGLLSRAAFGQVREHAAEWLQRYPDADAFCRRFTVDRSMVANIVSLGEAEGIPLDQKNFDAQYGLITVMLKAYIGDFLYGNDVFHRIALTQDKDLKTTRKFKN